MKRVSESNTRIEWVDEGGNWLAEAERDRVGAIWAIRYEDGEERFAGRPQEVIRHAEKAMTAKQSEA